MPEKIKGKVKWFSNRKGFGFVSPDTGGDDLFLHHSKIVSEAEYKTLRDGLEVEFEICTDEAGKPYADKVTAADGSAIPAPPPRPAPKKKATTSKSAEGAEDAKDENGESKPAAKKGKGRKGKQGKKPADDSAALSTDDEQGKGDSTAEPKKKGRNRNNNNNKRNGKRNTKTPSWHEELDESVLKAMETNGIKIDSGRAFVTVGDARLKIGTGGYIALAHAKGLVAEGTYTCDKEGNIAATWNHVLKLDGEEWKVASAEEESEALVQTLSLKDGAVTATGADETPETLWGEGKADPKDLFEQNGFQMRKVAFTASANPSRRGRGPRGRRPGGKEAAGTAAPDTPAPAVAQT